MPTCADYQSCSSQILYTCTKTPLSPFICVCPNYSFDINFPSFVHVTHTHTHTHAHTHMHTHTHTHMYTHARTANAADTTYLTAGFFDGSNGIGLHFSISYQDITFSNPSDADTLTLTERFSTISDNNYWLRSKTADGSYWVAISTCVVITVFALPSPHTHTYTHTRTHTHISTPSHIHSSPHTCTPSHIHTHTLYTPPTYPHTPHTLHSPHNLTHTHTHTSHSPHIHPLTHTHPTHPDPVTFVDFVKMDYTPVPPADDAEDYELYFLFLREQLFVKFNSFNVSHHGI